MTADRQLDGISKCSADYSVLYFSCGSNVSCREEQPWFSSTIICLSSSSAPVSLTNRHSMTHTCISPMYLRNTFQSPKKRKSLLFKDALVEQGLLRRPIKKNLSLTLQRSEFYTSGWSLLLQAWVFWCCKRGNKAISYLFEASLPPALLEMKKKIDLADKEHNGEKWKSGSFDDESGNIEPTMKDLLSSLSPAS